MKIFTKNNNVLAMACFLGSLAVASAVSVETHANFLTEDDEIHDATPGRRLFGTIGESCSTDFDCTGTESCECYSRRLEEKPRTKHKSRALRMVNEQATAARNSKRGIEAAVGSRRAKSAKSAKCTKGSKGTVDKCPNCSGTCVGS